MNRKDSEHSHGINNPVRNVYIHARCLTSTKIDSSYAGLLARHPASINSLYCYKCTMHLPATQFQWLDGSAVGE